MWTIELKDIFFFFKFDIILRKCKIMKNLRKIYFQKKPSSCVSVNDKISMVNTLVQMQNVTSYPFMHSCLRDGRTHVHALWFDVYTGEVHCFSRKEKVLK